MLPNRKAFSLTELLITSALLVVLFTTSLAGLVLLKGIFAANAAKATFQRDAAAVMNTIIEGKGNTGGIRLSEAASVTCASGAITFHGSGNVPGGAIARTYFLSGDGTTIYYSEANGVQQKKIYTAPQGATIGLTFITPPGSAPNFYVVIYVSIAQKINGNTVIGALSSSVYLRNHDVYSGS